MRLIVCLSFVVTSYVSAQRRNRNLDLFNYRGTVRGNLHNDFGPNDWEKIQCPDTDTCVSRLTSWESYGSFRPAPHIFEQIPGFWALRSWDGQTNGRLPRDGR
jgi:hypothetical protein